LVELRSGEECTAEVAIASGQAAHAIDYYRRAMANPDPRASFLARRSLVFALAGDGRIAEAKTLVMQAETEAKARQRYVREDVIALMWAAVGDHDRALQWFERAAASSSAGIGSLYYLVATLPLRHDERLTALAKRAGLVEPPQYWP
jgi:hypothetical protein